MIIDQLRHGAKNAGDGLEVGDAGAADGFGELELGEAAAFAGRGDAADFVARALGAI
jgi:hypothetical protein